MVFASPRPPINIADPDHVNTLNSNNIQQLISFKIYIWIDSRYPLRYLLLKFDTLQALARTTAFTTKHHSVSPKSLKCNNISISNCSIALKFDTEVKYLKLHRNLVNDYRWTPRLHSWWHFCIPQLFEMQYLHEYCLSNVIPFQFWSTFHVNWGQIITRYDFLWAR